MSNNEKKKNLAYYSDCFSQLNVYKNTKKGREALNQPILLLSVIDLITQKVINENIILISDELIKTFEKYWSILVPEPFKGIDFALPYFHLKNKSGKFWKLKFSSAYEGGRPQTISTLKRDVDYAYLDDELFKLLQDPSARQELIDAIITAWFSSSAKKLEDLIQINQEFEEYSDEENLEVDQEKETQNATPKIYLRKSYIREAFFRKTVIHIYDYRCAFCQLKVKRSLNQFIVDGAHIKPFSEFYDNQINNGISLCKNHHWAFDHGWFTIDDDYKIILANDLEEDSPNATPMKNFDGVKILVPDQKIYLPKQEALRWHREHIFKS